MSLFKSFSSGVFFTILCFSAIASSKALQMRSSEALSTKLTAHEFTAELKAGHHFNEKAPNGIQLKDQLIKPASLEKQKLVIKDLPADVAQGTAHLYVCDDAITYCETHIIALGKAKNAAEGFKSAQNKAVKQVIKADSHGFIQNNLTAALAKATQEKKNVLVDFGARWCPACLRLEGEIFSNLEFKKQTKKFVKVKVDVDLFSNAVLLNRYSIKGFPTILFLNAAGDEIMRFLDYQPLDLIKTYIAEVEKYPVTMEELEKQTKTQSVLEALWKRYFYIDDFKNSWAAMKELEVKPKEYATVQINLAQTDLKTDPKTKDSYVKLLKNSIAAEPESSRSLSWRQKLVEQLPEKSKEGEKVAQEAAQVTQKILASDELLQKAISHDNLGEFDGMPGFYVALMNVDVAEQADYETLKAWELVISEGQKAKISAKQPGAALRLLSAYGQAKKYDEAEMLITSLLKEKPLDGDLQRRKARILMELKKYDQAIALGEKALKNSYGTNEFYVLEPLIKSYLAVNNKAKAQNLVNQYLARNELNFSNMKSFKKKLEDFNAQISSAAEPHKND